MKKLSTLFAALAVLVTNVMVAVVAYNYGVLSTGTGFSAPPATALLYGIPFLVLAAACALLAAFFRKKDR